MKTQYSLFVSEVLEVDTTIGVSGARGHLGRDVVSELLQRPAGHEVVAITRTPETVSGPAQGRFGDYNRPESLPAWSAFGGVRNHFAPAASFLNLGFLRSGSKLGSIASHRGER